MSQPAKQPEVSSAAMVLAPTDFQDRGACPLCGAAGKDAFATVHDFDVIPVRRCKACGLMHSGRIMSASGTAKYYQDVFGSEFHRKGQMINAEVNFVALSKLVPLREVNTVLDVGCGYGYLPRMLKDAGKRPMGVEVSKGESEFARTQLGLDVRTGMLEQVGMPTGWFDAVASFEVIEHVPRPVEFVRSMAAHIRPGGFVIVGTDNFESPVVQRMGARFPKWIPHTHVNHFGPETLTETMRRAGLKVEGVWSYTPLENSIRSRLPKYRKPVDVKAAWNFAGHVKEEMGRNYPMFWLRRELAKVWSARLTLRKNGAGSMIFAVGRPRD